jgi:tetratricopeptide (TPR) repeat protein
VYKKSTLIVLCLAVSLTFAFSTPANDLYEEGKKLYEKGKYQDAADKLQEVVRLDPKHGQAYFYLASIYNLKWEKHAESLQYYTKTRLLLPDDPWPTADMAGAYAGMKDYTQAVAYYKKAISQFEAKKQKPWDWVLTETSRILRSHLNKPGDSVSLLDEAIKKYELENNPDILHELSCSYIDLKQYDKALYFNQKTLEAFAKKGERPFKWSLLNPAVIYLFYKNPAEPDKAVPYLERCLSPDFTDDEKDRAVDYMAYACYLLKKDEEFLRYANIYIEKGKDPVTRSAQIGRVADYYYKHGELDKAFETAGIQGKDSYLYRLLSVRKLDLVMEFHMREIMQKHMKWVGPGLVYLSLPKDSYYQKLLSLESSHPYMRIDSEKGENAACFDFSSGFPENLVLKMKMQYRMTWALPQQVRFHPGSGGVNDEFAHLQTDYFDIDNRDFVGTVGEISKNGTTAYEKIVAIKDWISANVVYFTTLPEYKDATGNPDKWIAYQRVSDIMRAKKGHCGHYSDLFTAMCRAVNIPARTISGILINLDEKHPGYHIVSEVYEAPTDRWIYVEPQGFVSLGNHSLQVIFTPDYRPKEKDAKVIDTIYLHHLESYKINNKKDITYQVYPNP